MAKRRPAVEAEPTRRSTRPRLSAAQAAADAYATRTMHAALDAIVRQAPDGKHTKPPQSLHGQLYFREV